MPTSTKRTDTQQDRRRANRAALSLSATMREGSRTKVQVRVIDLSTHGCRIECTSAVPVDACVWLSIPGIENQYCRVIWHCQEFVGLEFEKPLSAAVFDRLLKEQDQFAEKTITELRDIANRTHWLATQADIADIHILAELSRKCAVDAVVEGLRLSETKRGE
jgi:PilZ domain-containing protein